VVGAGITGLATAYELARRDADVLVVGDGAPGQSAGLGRIFRIAHRSPRLCALALEAHARWREWETLLGAGTLLGREGLVVTAPGRAEAMRAAGARADELGRPEIGALIPHLAPPHPWDGGILDPLGGSLRIKRALDALAARLPVRIASARAIDLDGTVHADGAVVDRLRVVEFGPDDVLERVGRNELVPQQRDLQPQAATATAVRQGFVESSNVDVTGVMTTTLGLQRAYEANQRMIRTQDELLSRAVSEIARPVS
jgi:hypothetical protein